VKPSTKKAAPKSTKTNPAKTGAGTIEKQIADVIKLIPDATMVIDPKGKVMAWNHAMEELTGVRAKDIIGKGDYEYSLPFYGERRPVLADIALKEVGISGKNTNQSLRGATHLWQRRVFQTFPRVLQRYTDQQPS